MNPTIILALVAATRLEATVLTHDTWTIHASAATPAAALQRGLT